jgi:hypothetical protein
MSFRREGRPAARRRQSPRLKVSRLPVAPNRRCWRVPAHSPASTRQAPIPDGDTARNGRLMVSWSLPDAHPGSFERDVASVSFDSVLFPIALTHTLGCLTLAGHYL